MMELKNVRTRNQFIAWLQENSITLEITESDYGEVADWFLAMQQARDVSEQFTTKDIAFMFLKGVAGIESDPDEEHAAWWRTVWEDVDAFWNEEGGDDEDAHAEEAEVTQHLMSVICNHFGVEQTW